MYLQTYFGERNTSMFTFLGDKQLRFGVTIFPAVEKVVSRCRRNT